MSPVAQVHLEDLEEGVAGLALALEDESPAVGREVGLPRPAALEGELARAGQEAKVASAAAARFRSGADAARTPSGGRGIGVIRDGTRGLGHRLHRSHDTVHITTGVPSVRMTRI